MKARRQIAAARTPDGSDLLLYQRDDDFLITVNGKDLMNSRQHESELELARLGCAHLADHKAPVVLIGGLGMGYTLRQALDLLKADAQVVVGELMDAVVDWNRVHFGALNGRPLEDTRVIIHTGDVVELIKSSRDRFDAILLDIDNGPHEMTHSGNRRLYSDEGVLACRRALKKHGCLAVWSAVPSKKFEQRLMRIGFHVRRYRASAYKGSKSQSFFVWVASGAEENLPPGGGAPRTPIKKAPSGRRKRRRGWRSAAK